jgi:hypothetical protein
LWDWPVKNHLSFSLKGMDRIMGSTLKTIVSFSAALISRSNRKKQIRKIDQLNETNRNVVGLGQISLGKIIPTDKRLGNLIISGGDQAVRNSLIVQNCRQSQKLGIPTLVIHEGNSELEKRLTNEFAFNHLLRVINATTAHYDPITRLTDDELARLVYEASSRIAPCDPTGILYVRILSTLLRKRGIAPYLRMLSSCPFHSLQSIILKEEQNGNMSGVEANSLRNDLSACMSSRAAMEFYLTQLVAESDILVWKSNLARSSSIMNCVVSGGIMSIDISSSAKKAQLSLIRAELKMCVNANVPFRVIIDAVSIASNTDLLEQLQKSSNAFTWSLSTPDISTMLSTRQDELYPWLAQSHKAILLAHGIRTSETLSSGLGEYDRLEMTQSHSGNKGIGQFGFHFGANDSVSTSVKRDRIIKPEEIMKLMPNEFFQLDNQCNTLFKGSIV